MNREIATKQKKFIIQLIFIFSIAIVSASVFLYYYINFFWHVIPAILDIFIIILIYISYKYAIYRIEDNKDNKTYKFQEDSLLPSFSSLAVFLIIMSIIIWFALNNRSLPNPINEPLKFLLIFPLIIYAMISIYIALSLGKRYNKS